jgi:hypothetical protein
MSRIIVLLLIGAGLTLAGCASSTQEGLQRPGTAARNGLQVPPDIGERPTQTAAVPQGR